MICSEKKPCVTFSVSVHLQFFDKFLDVSMYMKWKVVFSVRQYNIKLLAHYEDVCLENI